MNDGPDNLLHFQALAALPAGDARRTELERHIASLPADERSHWGQLLAETDALYALLQRVETPEGLEGRLLRIGQEESPGQWRLGSRISTRRWPLYAAAVVVLALIGALALLYGGDNSLPKPLSGGTAAELAALTVGNHEAAPVLEISSADPAEVEAKLKVLRPGFPVRVLRPRANLKLLGGGACSLDGMAGVYTRWQGGDETYTVYQLDGRAMGIPKSFARTEAVPTQLWSGVNHYHVILWPGVGMDCTWALVMERDSAIDAFSNLY